MVSNSKRLVAAWDNPFMRAYLDTADSPAGRVSFAVDEGEAFLCLQFERGDYRAEMKTWLEDTGFTLSRDQEKTSRARTELLDYNAGERRKFDSPLATDGTAWQKSVWLALARIPFGERRAYSEVAAMAGRAKHSARAVGSANAANRLPLIVPCHRVVGSDGSLTGFAGGVHIKEMLLEHESRVASLFGY